MIETIELFFSTVWTVFTYIYASGKIMTKKLDLKRTSAIFAIIFSIITVFILFKLTDNFVRVVITFITLTFANIIIYKSEKVPTFLTTFFVTILYAIIEIIFCSCVTIFLKIDMDTFGQMFFGSFMSNAIISILVLLTIKIPFIFKKFYSVIDSNVNYDKKFILTVIVFGVFFFSLTIYYLYFQLNSIQMIFITLFITVVYTIIVFRLFYEHEHSEYIQRKNNILIENIVEYEKIIEIQKMESHENKNQLRIIKQMILPENTELNSYLEELIDEKLKEDLTLLGKVQNIPNGGLRALIYSKLVKLDESYNINLIISRNINSKTLDSIDARTNVDMCKVLGVFLDNAIESSSFTKEKLIGIDIYIENKKFKIKLSNTFCGNIDLEKIDLPNYSSKSQNRGYGLSLVKKIINQNKKMENKRQITGNIFCQILTIEI